MKVKFISLASGSSGNCYYLGTETYGILIDAGIGIRTIKKVLKDYNILMDSIRAVFITHDHADHIKAVGNLGEKMNIPVYTIDEILEHKVEIPQITHPLPLFIEYLQQGYYPFGKDKTFEIELDQVINQTMEIDIPQYANMNVSTGRKLKQLLMIISQSVPFKPVLQKLADMIGVSRNYLADYLLYIEKAGMIAQLRDDTGGIRGLGKVEKIYIDNTNLIYALGRESPNIGNIRETFFYNQMRVKQEITSSKISDFQIGERTFEIGGKNKGQKQIEGLPKGYIVKDDIENGYANIIPLWYFGMNY